MEPKPLPKIKMGLATIGFSLICVGGGIVLLSELSEGTQPTKTTFAPEMGPGIQEVSPSLTESLPPEVNNKKWDCKPIPEGSWITQELRKRGYLDDYAGPYRIIHEDEPEDEPDQYFSNFSQLPDLVFPGEELCVKIKGGSYLDPGKNRQIFSFNKHQFNQSARLSQQIQTALRSKQGF